MAARGRRPVAERPLRDLVAHFGGRFAEHMQTKEDVLYPAIESALPEASTSLVALREDHRELRGLIGAIAMRLEQPRHGIRDEQLRVLTRDLIDLLRLHIRKEEGIVFSVASRVLQEDEISMLARRIGRAGTHPRPRETTRRPGKAS